MAALAVADKKRPLQNENLAENWNWRGFNMVLGSPNVEFGELGTETGKSPKASQAGGAAAACSDAQDTDAAFCWIASVVASR